MRHYPYSNAESALALLRSGQVSKLADAEVSLALKYLRDEAGIKRDDIFQKAKLVMSNAVFRRHIRIATNLHPKAWAQYSAGNISMGHAYALCRVKDEKTQDKALDNTIQRDYSVRQLENLIRGARPKIKKEGRAAPTEVLEVEDEHTEYFKQLEVKISDALGAPTRIVRDPSIDALKAGYIQIQYYGLDVFDGLMQRMGVQVSEDEF